MTEAPFTDSPTIDVPGYRIERMLGRGGFGLVLLATGRDGRRVALKVANAGDGTAAAQLAREEKALRAVGPRVAPAVHESATLPAGPPYLALELLEPPTLLERLHQVGGPLERREFAAVAIGLCDAVGAVHAAAFAIRPGPRRARAGGPPRAGQGSRAAVRQRLGAEDSA